MRANLLLFHIGEGNFSALADGFAAALQESLADTRQQGSGPQVIGPWGYDSTEQGHEDSASLILKLLIRAASRQGPNLAHLLLGFDVTDGLQGPQTLAAS